MAKKASTDVKDIKIVYMDPENHNQYVVTGVDTDKVKGTRNVPGTDRPGIAVSPSSYDRTAVNMSVDQDFLDAHPELKGTLMVGDHVDLREVNKALGITKEDEPAEGEAQFDAEKKLPVEDEVNYTDEELNQSKTA